MWPKSNRSWSVTKIRQNVLYTQKIIKPDTIFGVENLINKELFKFNLVANSNVSNQMYLLNAFEYMILLSSG